MRKTLSTYNTQQYVSAAYIVFGDEKGAILVGAHAPVNVSKVAVSVPVIDAAAGLPLKILAPHAR